MKNSRTPAFPQSNGEIVKAFMDVDHPLPNGLTKREWFAGLAMQGACSARDDDGDSLFEFHSPTRSAKLAVEWADALIAELEATE